MSRRALLLLLAGGIIIFTIVLLRSRLNDVPVVPAATTAPAPASRIVVAKRDLVVGSFIQGLQDLDWGPAPDASVPTPVAQQQPQGDANNPDAPQAATPQPVSISHENYLYEGAVKLTDFNGAVVRRALHAGDPVPQFAIMKSGEGGFMSAVLEPGMRAVSIGVNPTSGNAGFVSPGDRIDLIVTHRIKAPQLNNASATDEFVVSETFVRNARVVAVDQMIDNPENKAILAKTITVEVSPRNAEAISVAADLGKISIALRSLSTPDSKLSDKSSDSSAHSEASDKDKEAPKDANGEASHVEQGYTRDSDISELLSNHKSAIGTRVHVLHGDKSENIDFDQDKK